MIFVLNEALVKNAETEKYGVIQHTVFPDGSSNAVRNVLQIPDNSTTQKKMS